MTMPKASIPSEPAPLPPVPSAPTKPKATPPEPSEPEDDAEPDDLDEPELKAIEHWANDKTHTHAHKWKHVAAANLRGWHEGAQVSEAEYDKAVAEALAIPIR